MHTNLLGRVNSRVKVFEKVAFGSGVAIDVHAEAVVWSEQDLR
jgi:hypothetical protein